MRTRQTMAVIIAWAMVCMAVPSKAQNTSPIDYLAHVGSCEIDYNKDGITDNLFVLPEGLSASEFQCSLDTAVRFAGTASQKVQLNRNASSSGSVRLAFNTYHSVHMSPHLNEPLRLRITYRAEGFTNATYEIFAESGSRRVALVSPTAATTNGWQTAEAIVPAQNDSANRPRVFFSVRINANAGRSGGTLWVDEVRALSAATLRRSVPLPNGLRLALSYLESEIDWARLAQNHPWTFLVGAREWRLPAFRRMYPEVPHAAYVFFTGPVISSAVRHITDIYDYDDVWNNNRHWLLRDQNNNYIRLDDTYYINIGLPEVRTRARERLLDLIPRAGFPQYIFLDNLDMRARERYNIQGYNNNQEWVTQVINWVNEVGSAVRNAYGVRFIPNIAWSPGFMLRGINGGPDAPGVALLDYMGGFWMEHAFCHGYNPSVPNRPRNYTLDYGRVQDANNWLQWTLRNEIRLATEYPDKIIVINPTFDHQQPNFRQKLRFTIAMTLAVQHQNTYLVLDPRFPNRIHPEGFVPPEVMVPLGNPIAPMQFVQGNLLEGGLIVRQYQYGVVVVNPVHDRTFSYTVPIRGYNWDRQIVNAGTQVQLPPHTGMVFYAAPEVRVWVRAGRHNARPGEEVSYKVEYANDGLAAAQNVEIRVPLPEGLQLVSSNPPATVQGNELVWVVAQLPAGARGTMSFRVRVQ